MIVFRVWKDAIKDNWQDATTIEEANAIDFGFGYDELQLSTFDKTSHLAEINALHEAEFDRRWRAADYVGRWEVASAANDETNEYNSEAKSIMAYWWDGWDAIEAYSENVTEQNAQDPIEFVINL